MKLFGILFGKYKLIPINDFNALYGVINAAYSRLQAIEVSTERTYHAGETDNKVMKKYYSFNPTRFIQIVILVVFILGLLMGYELCLLNHQPVKMSQEIKELKADIDILNKAWVNQFSKQHKLIVVK